MKKKIVLFNLAFLACFCLPFLSLAQSNISYELSMPEPQTHYFEVEMIVNGNTKKNLDLSMPVWAPGSYLVREFAKSIEAIEASNNSGELEINKINKNTWRVLNAGTQAIKIKYKVYAFELSVRTSFLNAEHGYVNGTSVFLLPTEAEKTPIDLSINPYKDWKKVSTALSPVKGKTFTYHAPNYDILADSPIEIGNQDEFKFKADGTEFTIAMFGTPMYDKKELINDLEKIVKASSQVFGNHNPNKEYLFIIQNLEYGSGGLEHLNSTTLQVNRWTYSNKKDYQSFLSLACHEYFHLWNVKRLRPESLGPFDYHQENYTKQLWVSEGITSYYDELLLKRCDIYSTEEYLNKIQGTINYIENKNGKNVQSLAMSSFDAWIKAYRPNENSHNTTVSYYSKGSVVALLLDLEILHATKGKKRLDDLMKHLYKKVYLKENRGFSEDEFKQAANEVSGTNLDNFFKDYIYGTRALDYNKYFNYVGLELEASPASKETSELGVYARESNGRLIIKKVNRGTAAYEDGLNAKDEIIAINNFRLNKGYFDDMLDMAKPNDVLNFTISRDGIIQDIKVTLRQSKKVTYKIKELEDDKKAQRKLQEIWLK